MKTETPVHATDLDPDCTDHCGCGVPFTKHCPTCAEYLGVEYHRPDEEPLRRESKGGATFYFDGDLHVGTVRKLYKGRYTWLTRFTASHEATADAAEMAMRKELAR